MYYAYSIENGRLVRLAAERDVADAAWIDLIQPNDAEIAQLRVLGVPVPSLAEMEEIELSNRLYREDGLDYMTAMLPGERAGGSGAKARVDVRACCFLAHLLSHGLDGIGPHVPRTQGGSLSRQGAGRQAPKAQSDHHA